MTLEKGRCCGKDLAYLNFNDVIVDLLSQNSAKGRHLCTCSIQERFLVSIANTRFEKDFVFSYRFANCYDHPISSDGCQEYQEYCNREIERRGHEFRLLLPMFYLDEYEHNTARHQSFLGIYMILGNLHSEVWLQSACWKYSLILIRFWEKEFHKAKNRILLAAVPAGADLFEVVQHVLVNPALKLERGYRAYFGPTKRVEYFIGSIFAILGPFLSTNLCLSLPKSGSNVKAPWFLL